MQTYQHPDRLASLLVQAPKHNCANLSTALMLSLAHCVQILIPWLDGVGAIASQRHANDFELQQVQFDACTPSCCVNFGQGCCGRGFWEKITGL